jgi:hypothetical protein
MSTIPAFKINGVIDTSKSVLSNIDVLCRASGCWLTYDSTTALWSVIINRTGSSVKSFTDANIIGSISITGSGIDSMYNSVEVTYPNQDLLNNRDSVNFTIPDANRFPNELDKKLTISLDCINNQIQAAYIGIIELNQNRIDKIVQFTTDYSVLGLKAGDLIDITTTMYGYTSKVFRITKIAEEDADDGTIQLSITALEYDAGVYDQGSLVYTARTTATGVVPKSANTALNALDRQAGLPTLDAFQVDALTITADNNNQTLNLGRSYKLPFTGRYKIVYNINWGSNIAPPPPMGSLKNSTISLSKNGSAVSLGNFASTGDANVQVYEDHLLTGFFSATAGDTIAYSFIARSNLSPAAYAVPAGYPAFTVPSGTIVAVWISADLQFIGV